MLNIQIKQIEGKRNPTDGLLRVIFDEDYTDTLLVKELSQEVREYNSDTEQFQKTGKGGYQDTLRRLYKKEYRTARVDYTFIITNPVEEPPIRLVGQTSFSILVGPRVDNAKLKASDQYADIYYYYRTQELLFVDSSKRAAFKRKVLSFRYDERTGRLLYRNPTLKEQTTCILLKKVGPLL